MGKAIKKCDECNGRGYYYITVVPNEFGDDQMEVVCGNCDGYGVIEYQKLILSSGIAFYEKL